MHEELSEIVEETIKLEMNVADLYQLYASIFPEDIFFWEQLSNEEKQHAGLIRTGRDVLLSCDEFPVEVLSPSLNALVDANSKLTSLLEEIRDNPPSRITAFRTALYWEESTGEIHFQRAMDMRPATGYVKILQDLNKDEMNHAQRIREYMVTSGL